MVDTPPQPDTATPEARETTPADPSSSAPVSDRRLLTSLFIVAWLAVQLALPLSYYFDQRDRQDERFAWRMFSPRRSVTCNVELYVGGQREADPIGLRADLHVAWLAWLERGRLVVARRYMEERCRKERDAGNPEPWVSMRMICRNPGGEGSEQRLAREDNVCDEPGVLP